MMKVKNAALVSVVVVGIASGSLAQVVPNLDKGTKEIAGSGSLVGDTPSGDEVTLQLAWGYFVRDQLQVALTGGFTDDDFWTAWNLGVGTEYNFTPEGWGPWVPYVGAALRGTGTDFGTAGDESTGAARASGGIKYFIHDNVALGFEAAWNYAFDDVYFKSDGSTSDNQWRALFNIRVYYD